CGILLGWLGIHKFILGWWVLSKALLEKLLLWMGTIQSLGLRPLLAPALAGLAGFIMTASGLASAPFGLLESEFIFETAPFPSCHASTIAETKPGELV